MKPHEFSVLGPLMGGFGSQAFLGCLHAEDGTLKPAVMVFLPDEIVDNPDLFRRVWQETELGTTIDHVNVIGVMGLARLDEGIARVVDYADAESLRSVFRRATTLKKPVSPALACAVVADAAMGVHYAFELGATETGEGWIHGGIRPETLQVSFQGMAKVTGYGATTIAEVMRKHRGTDAKDAYTAPEQTYGGRAAATVQTDVYALGCVLYEALTGKAPFGADNDLAEAMMRDELVRRVDADDGITDAMARVVLRATKKKSTERYGSAFEMRMELLDTCGPADAKEIRRYMDELFPPDTVPRATRDQMLISARETPPPPTGRLLVELPADMAKATRSRDSHLTDAEIEAAHGKKVEVTPVKGRPAPPPSTEAAPTDPPSLVPASIAAGPTAPMAPAPPDAAARLVERALEKKASGDASPPAAPAAAPRAPSAPPPSWQAQPTAPPHSSQGYASQTAPPVVYKTPTGLVLGFGLTLGVAATLIFVLVSKDDDKPAPPPPPPVVAPPPPPPPPPTPVEPPIEPLAPIKKPVGGERPDKPEEQPAPKATGPGKLVITADPPSLKITVNGSDVGTGSGTFEGKAGVYKVVGKDAAQGISVAKTVKLKPGQTMNVELEAQKASLAFDQLPDGVEVFVDGKRIGKTPLASLQLWAGPHKVVVKKGGQEIPYKLTIPPGREAYITAEFN
ncbi:MAG: protein kinase [Deltaproteobacteria bacterium]|nr:protein kinase [Deltaproteobacteria bacterium]